MKQIRAITFDVGGTLIDPWPSVGAVYAEVAAEFGLNCQANDLNKGFADAWKNRVRFDYTRGDWLGVVQQAFVQFGEISPALFDAIYDRFTEPRSWLIYDDVVPVLQQLQQQGFRLAVLSNWDERLVPLLERLGLSSYFEHAIVSSAIGAHKPDQRIFGKALDLLHLSAAEVVHVGDSQREDIEGARMAGIKALRIRRSGRSEPHDIERLTEVLSMLSGHH